MAWLEDGEAGFACIVVVLKGTAVANEPIAL